MINLFANSYSSLPLGIGNWGLGFLTLGAILLFAIALGLIALKGYCLWTAARRNENGWFVAILLVNTLGVLELIYLYFIVEKWKKNKIEKTETTTTTPSVQ